MKEKWTQDLQKKMTDYEVPTIPDGLWEEIDSALHTNTQHLTPNTQHPSTTTQYWRKACAAILLLLLIPTALIFLYKSNTEEQGKALVEASPNPPIKRPTRRSPRLHHQRRTGGTSPNPPKRTNAYRQKRTSAHTYPRLHKRGSIPTIPRSYLQQREQRRPSLPRHDRFWHQPLLCHHALTWQHTVQQRHRQSTKVRQRHRRAP